MRGIVRARTSLLAKSSSSRGGGWSPASPTSACVYRGLLALDLSHHPRSSPRRGVEVWPEMVIEVLRARRRIIEIPINYRNPDVQHEHVHAPYQTPAMFGRVLGLILSRRLADTALARHLWRPDRPGSCPGPTAPRDTPPETARPGSAGDTCTAVENEPS